MKTAQDLVMLAKQQIHEIGVDEADQCIADADVLLDVREPSEYEQGHIRGSVNIPRGLLEFKIGSIPALEPRDTKVVIYCKTSGRSALAAASLMAMGYMNVTSIAGGIDDWVASGKSIMTPSMPSFE